MNSARLGFSILCKALVGHLVGSVVKYQQMLHFVAKANSQRLSSDLRLDFDSVSSLSQDDLDERVKRGKNP